jgi:phage tail sheath protein FI
MAEVLISPGVLARENDQSQVTAGPVQAGAAIIGPTPKGQQNIPKLVTSYSEYLANFGSTFTSGSGAVKQQFTYFTSISAYNYFQNGGTSLLVTRVCSQSQTPATSSFVFSGSDAPPTEGDQVFVLETLSDGAIMNNTGSEGTNNTLTDGTVDNVRWEITSPNTSSGVFSLLIRAGNDTGTAKQVLETYPNVSLDPNASNYIARVVGDQTQVLASSGASSYLQTTGSYRNASRYVRVKAVNLKTFDYLDNNGNAKDIFTGSIPNAQSGSFGDAGGINAPTIRVGNYYQNVNDTDSQGLIGTDYTNAIGLLANRDEFRYNLITAPGLILDNGTTGAGWTTIQSNTETRGDAMFVGDLVNYGSTITVVGNVAATVDSSYVATYWPWLQVTDPDSRELVWVPASTMIPGVYAYNDRAGEPWFAPAGINRGGLGVVNQAERKLTNSDRDTLYTDKVNPIATFPGQGIVVFGQKTLQTKASALDRVNVRRLLITLKNYISQIADTLVFEQNTAATRNTFLSQVNPYLESVQQRQGLYAFKVVMDNTNNTPDVIDRNELIGAVYLQPTKTAEFIYLDFNILPTGATFPA